MNAQPITHDSDEDRFEVRFIPCPAEAYARAFARAGVAMPNSLTVRLPMPLSAAPDADLHRLLDQLDEREAALLVVRNRLRHLPAGATDRVLHGPLMDAALESTTAVRECLLLELSWRDARGANLDQPGERP